VDLWGCVFCGEEEDGPGVVDRELAEAGCAGGDGESHFQSEESLADLGRSPNEADGLVGPEVLDEPRGLV
jgi:hypothetical protein